MTDLEEPPRRRTADLLLILLFAVYLVLLSWIVLWKLEAPWIGEAALLPRPIKLVPFVATAEAGASAPLEVALNVLLFVPFGLYLGLLAPSWRIRRMAGVLAGASLALESAQHLLSVGSFDSTDVIVNTVGGLAGVGLLALARRRGRPRSTASVARNCLIGTVLALVLVAAFVASPLHHTPQHDVVVSMR